MSYTHLLECTHLADLVALATRLADNPGPDDSNAPIVIGGIQTWSVQRGYEVQDIAITAQECRDLILGLYAELDEIRARYDSVIDDLTEATNLHTKSCKARQIVIAGRLAMLNIRSQILNAISE
jgi:hypothetical protein